MPLEVALEPEEYKRRLRAEDRETDEPSDPGNRAINFRGERRSNATHRSLSDPDCRYVSKGSSGTGAYPGYTVNALMENRHRLLLGLGVEVFQGVTSEKQGVWRCSTGRDNDFASDQPRLAPTRASFTRTSSRPSASTAWPS